MTSSPAVPKLEGQSFDANNAIAKTHPLNEVAGSSGDKPITTTTKSTTLTETDFAQHAKPTTEKLTSEDKVGDACAVEADEVSGRNVHSSEESSDRKVLVLYVGGTLGMAPNANGALEPVKGYLTEKMREMPELKAKGMPKFEILEYETLKDSSDMGPADWCTMCNDIAKNYYDYDGFLICHGTDTMHYSAAALSFMLENLAKPVIFTGAMVPFIEPYNDARRNIIVGMMFAASDALCEVCLFCNDVLIRGCRAIKGRQTLNAFESPNFPPLAIMSADKFELNMPLLLRQPTGAFSPVKTLKPSNVVSLLIVPGFDEVEFVKFVKAFGKVGHSTTPDHASVPTASSATATASDKTNVTPITTFTKRPIDCIIFEVSGLSFSEPHAQRMIGNVLRSSVEAGIVVIVSNHDYRGAIRLPYARQIRKLCPEAVLIHDMTSETAVVKAKYLFGRGYSAETVKKWMPLSMRGELTPVAVDVLIGKL